MGVAGEPKDKNNAFNAFAFFSVAQKKGRKKGMKKGVNIVCYTYIIPKKS